MFVPPFPLFWTSFYLYRALSVPIFHKTSKFMAQYQLESEYIFISQDKQNYALLNAAHAFFWFKRKS